MSFNNPHYDYMKEEHTKKTKKNKNSPGFELRQLPTQGANPNFAHNKSNMPNTGYGRAPEDWSGPRNAQGNHYLS